MRHLLFVLALQACTTEPETLELTPSSKADGSASLVVTLDPGRSVRFTWSCKEYLELNGCDTTVSILTEPTVPADSQVAVFIHEDIDTQIETTYPITGPKTELQIEGWDLSYHMAQLKNTSSGSHTFGVGASWH